MRTFLFFLLITIFTIRQLPAQTIILEKFDSKKCDQGVVIKREIAVCTDIDKAEAVLIKHCGLAIFYKLYCADCPVNKMIRRGPAKKEFTGSNLRNTSSLSGKGDYKLYNLLQLRSMLVDSLAIFDSMRIDISGMPETDKKKAASLFFIRQDDSQKIYPLYNKKTGMLQITRRSVCNGDNYTVILKAGYTDTEEKILTRPLTLFFINPQEKASLLEMAIDLKESSKTAFTEVTGLEYLQCIIANKYGQVDTDGLYKWINQVNL